MIDPAMLQTADGPMGPAPVDQPTTAVQALAEFLGVEAQRQAAFEQVASAAMQMLMEMAGDPGMMTADGPVGPEPMPGMEDDPMGEEPMGEPAGEMPMEYGA